jgi:hypothetical protein
MKRLILHYLVDWVNTVNKLYFVDSFLFDSNVYEQFKGYYLEKKTQTRVIYVSCFMV